MRADTDVTSSFCFEVPCCTSNGELRRIRFECKLTCRSGSPGRHQLKYITLADPTQVETRYRAIHNLITQSPVAAWVASVRFPRIAIRFLFLASSQSGTRSSSDLNVLTKACTPSKAIAISDNMRLEGLKPFSSHIFLRTRSISAKYMSFVPRRVLAYRPAWYLPDNEIHTKPLPTGKQVRRKRSQPEQGKP